jgi:hypothetical protein
MEIQTVLRRLRFELYDAIWEGNDSEEARLQREIRRLEMLVSYGETYDLPF